MDGGEVVRKVVVGDEIWVLGYRTRRDEDEKVRISVKCCVVRRLKVGTAVTGKLEID